MTDLPNGITRQVHVEHSLEHAATVIAHVRLLIQSRLTPTTRQALSQQLAGVIGHCESVRLWLNKGAPR